jgi:hypothetical protein
MITFEDYAQWFRSTADPAVEPSRFDYNALTVSQRQTIRETLDRWLGVEFVAYETFWEPGTTKQEMIDAAVLRPQLGDRLTVTEIAADYIKAIIEIKHYDGQDCQAFRDKLRKADELLDFDCV